jgi:hypothetical protein
MFDGLTFHLLRPRTGNLPKSAGLFNGSESATDPLGPMARMDQRRTKTEPRAALLLQHNPDYLAGLSPSLL